jgi:hypothetical protein
MENGEIDDAVTAPVVGGGTQVKQTATDEEEEDIFTFLRG